MRRYDHLPKQSDPARLELEDRSDSEAEMVSLVFKAESVAILTQIQDSNC